MPIVPRFRISQDDEYVYIKINVPYIKVSEAEMIADGNDFSFYCKPYLLKLTFPHNFDGDDETRCRATYDPFDENGTITGYLPKSTKGQHFEDLDLISTLVQKRIEKDRMKDLPKSLIEVIESQNFDESVVDGDSYQSAARGNNEQHTKIAKLDSSSESANQLHECEQCLSNIQITKPRYGFNGQYSGILGVLAEDSVLELKDNPDKTASYRRRELRVLTENALFSKERYLGDFFDGESDAIYQSAMKFEPFWIKAWDNRSKKVKDVLQSSCTENSSSSAVLQPQTQTSSSNVNAQSVESSVDNSSELFDEIERSLMARLPRKEYLIGAGSSQEKSVILGMIDILYSFCYDYRFNCGEKNVESPESITKMSATLSWLEVYESPRDDCLDIIKIVCRRSVIYPYFRIWKYTRKILADVAKILFLGRRYVLKCFLKLYDIFEHTDQYYILNKLYLIDYCVWIQTCLSDSVISLVAKEFNEAKREFENSKNCGKDLMDLKLQESEDEAIAIMNDSNSNENENC